MKTKKITKKFILRNFNGYLGKGTYEAILTCEVPEDYEIGCDKKTGEVRMYQDEDVDWKGETCKLCKKEQRIAWSVKDSLWNKIVDEKYRNKVLCLECFLKIADKKGINISKKDFIFLGWIGNNIEGDILINVEK